MAWIENDEGDVLLVRPTAGQNIGTVSGDKVKAKRIAERALKREIREETGLRVCRRSLSEDVMDTT